MPVALEIKRIHVVLLARLMKPRRASHQVASEPQYRVTVLTKCPSIERLDHRPVDGAALKRQFLRALEAKTLAQVRETANGGETNFCLSPPQNLHLIFVHTPCTFDCAEVSIIGLEPWGACMVYRFAALFCL